MVRCSHARHVLSGGMPVRRTWMWCLGLVLLTALLPASAFAITIQIHGNLVLNEFVYRAVVQLPPDAAATQVTADQVADQIRSFLWHAGYELAVVQAVPEGAAIVVHVDEGQLEKVIFRNRGTWETIRLRLYLNLPHNVFNRPWLEARLDELRHQMGFQSAGFELRDIPQMTHVGPQLEELHPIPGLKLVQPPRSKELFVQLDRADWRPGAHFRLILNRLDGLVAGTRYQYGSLMIPDDRLMVEGMLGVRRDFGDHNKSRLELSVLGVNAAWYMPMLGNHYRPYVQIGTQLITRQRRDLGLDRFRNGLVEGSINVEGTWWKQLRLIVGAGVQARTIFGLRYFSDAPGPANDLQGHEQRHQFREFITTQAVWNIDPDRIRRDQGHTLQFDAQTFLDGKVISPSRIATLYQNVFAFGWHDLFIRAREVSLFGRTLFVDEEPLSRGFVRGVFGQTLYARHALGATVEFRWSVIRDLFKVGVFLDGTGYDSVETSGKNKFSLHAAMSTGGGVHILLYESFQLDLDYAYGLTSNHLSDHGLFLKLGHAY